MYPGGFRNSDWTWPTVIGIPNEWMNAECRRDNDAWTV